MHNIVEDYRTMHQLCVVSLSCPYPPCPYPPCLFPSLPLPRDDWLDNLQRAMTPLQLRTCLGELEAVIIPGFLTKEYVRHPRVVLGAYTSDQADPVGGVLGLPESSGAR